MPHSLLFFAWLSGGAHALPPLREGASSAAIQQAYAAWEQGPTALAGWRSQRLHPGDEDGLQVVAELAPGVDPDRLLACVDAELPAAWAERWVDAELAGQALVQLWTPYADLPTLEACPGILRLREPRRPRPHYEFSEGYDAMFRQDWHAQGVSGRGVKIAILDVGFAGYEDQLGRELPSSVETWSVSEFGGSTHGTAVAEIVHDIAPAAELSLYQFATDVEFLDAVQAIATSKVHIVNGSVGFDNIWHADGSSPYTQAVDLLVSDFGKTWVAAAGNENQRYRIGPLSEVREGVVAIDGLSPVWVASSGGWVQVSLRWSEPMGQAAVDLDLLLLDEAGELCGQGADWQDGDDDPYEYAECHSGSGWVQAFVVTNDEDDDVTGLEGFLYSYGGLELEDAATERNLTLPGDTRLGISVGAVDLPVWDQVASYSSRGPTDEGEQRPHLVAPAGVSTASYGASLFSGTSAATPHVTGTVALLLHADRLGMDPLDVRDWLIGSTIDIGVEGKDNASGAGFLSPDAVPWRGCHCAARGPSRGGSSWVLALFACAAALLQWRRMG